MILASIATLAVSASAMLPLGNLAHLHIKPVAAADSRIDVTLRNTALAFRDIKVDGHTYTIDSGHSVTIKAPAGTPVYSGSTMYSHQRGALLLTVNSQVNHQTISLD